MTDKIIEESGLKEIDKNLVYGNIIYLEKTGLIKGQKYIVPNYPYAINITNTGIDKVEAIAYQFYYDIEHSANVDQTTKTQIRKILKDNGPSSKITAVLRYVKQNPEPFENIFEKLLKLFFPQQNF